MGSARVSFGEAHIVDRRAHIVLVDGWIAWLRQDLIDAPPEHDISADKEGNGLCAYHHDATPSWQRTMPRRISFTG